MSERMRIEPRVDRNGVIVIGATHGDCFHPLGWIGDSDTLAMMAFPNLEEFRAFVRQLAQISVALSQPEGLALAEVMAEAERLLGGSGGVPQDGDGDGTLG